MPHASHRLDLNLVPGDLERDLDRPALDDLFRAWERAGWIAGSSPGPAVEGLVEGGFRRIWVDDPGRITLYANQQGGFHVRCPRCGEGAARAFGKAVQAWREGGARSMRCPACEVELALEELILLPPGRFARWALVLSDCAALHLSPAAKRDLEAALGSMVTVSRRVG